MPRRLPPLNALRAFEAAARHGSFSAAAQELRVTDSAVSQQVRTLERYIGTRLFKRLPHGLLLTELGSTYLPVLTAGFDRLSEATVRLRTGALGGLLTVAALPAFASGWLLPRIARFRERYPRIDLLLKTSRTLADFRREDVDVAIRYSAGTSADTKSVLLMGEEVFPVASPTLVAPSLLPMSLADLRSIPLLHDADGPSQPWLSWHEWFERGGVESPTALSGLTFTDSIVLLSAAVAGLGVALGRGPNIEGLLSRGQLVRLTQDSWKAEWSYRLVAPPANFSRPNVRAFVEWIVEEAEGNSALTRTLSPARITSSG
jgi:LysR family transcriptional regulator, glycine cleavage system transcriptional activator